MPPGSPVFFLLESSPNHQTYNDVFPHTQFMLCFLSLPSVYTSVCLFPHLSFFFFFKIYMYCFQRGMERDRK